MIVIGFVWCVCCWGFFSLFLFLLLLLLFLFVVFVCFWGVIVLASAVAGGGGGGGEEYLDVGRCQQLREGEVTNRSLNRHVI